MENVDDDELPVLDPPNPEIRLREGATAGTRVHVIQAFDPDGGRVTFEFRGQSTISLITVSSRMHRYRI